MCDSWKTRRNGKRIWEGVVHVGVGVRLYVCVPMEFSKSTLNFPRTFPTAPSNRFSFWNARSSYSVSWRRKFEELQPAQRESHIKAHLELKLNLSEALEQPERSTLRSSWKFQATLFLPTFHSCQTLFKFSRELVRSLSTLWLALSLFKRLQVVKVFLKFMRCVD